MKAHFQDPGARTRGVWLNGNRQRYCFFADDEAGYVVRAKAFPASDTHTVVSGIKCAEFEDPARVVDITGGLDDLAWLTSGAMEGKILSCQSVVSEVERGDVLIERVEYQ